MSIKSPQVRRQFLQRLGQMIPVRGKTVNCGVAPKKVPLHAPGALRPGNHPDKNLMDCYLVYTYTYMYRTHL